MKLFVLLKFSLSYAVVIQSDLYSFIALFLLFCIALKTVLIGLAEYTRIDDFFPSFG